MMTDERVRRTGLTAKGETKRDIVEFLLRSNETSEPEIREYLRHAVGIRDQFSIKKHLHDLEMGGILVKDNKRNTNFWRVNLDSNELMAFLHNALHEIDDKKLPSFIKTTGYQNYVRSEEMNRHILTYLKEYVGEPPSEMIDIFKKGVCYLPGVFIEVGAKTMLKTWKGVLEFCQTKKERDEFLRNLPYFVIIYNFGLDRATFPEPEMQQDFNQFFSETSDFIKNNFKFQPVFVPISRKGIN